MSEEDSMSFLDHLEELRLTIIRSLGVLLVGMMIAGIFAKQILAVIIQPLADMGIDTDTFLVIPQVMGSLKVGIAVSFWGGLCLALPFIVSLLLGFIFPGLHDHEKKIVKRCAFASVFLFFLGAGMGYWGTVGHALHALLFTFSGWVGVAPEWIYLTDYVMFVLKLVIGFGLAFELPLLLLGLGFADVVEVGQLREKRRHVVVALLFMAMLLTPPEPVSQLMMAGSLFVMYEICILILSQKRTPGLNTDAV